MYGSQKSTDLCSCANIQTDVDGCVEWVALRDFYVTKMENDKHFQIMSEHFCDSFNSHSPIFGIVMGYMNVVAVGISLINVYFLINSLVNYQVKIFKVGFNS